MASALTRKITSVAAAMAGAFLLMGAAPAHAATENDSEMFQATAWSPLGEGDNRFRALFADWKALDESASFAPAGKVSVPSRIPLGDARLTSDFGLREHPVLGRRRMHKGIDLAAPTGTPVYAAADGLISMAQWFSSYGNYVQIEHGAGLETRYAHLSGYIVQPGERVKKGDLIGYVGSTGRSTGPHLHYEVRVAGEAVNPIPYMIETGSQQAFALVRGEGGEGGPE